jgi:lactate dehydrogenase-like 2-hydroxyacid dehydrogenase
VSGAQADCSPMHHRPATGPGVLQVGPLLPTLAADLKTLHAAVVLPDGRAEQEAFLKGRGGEFDLAVTSGRIGVSADLMDALPNLVAIVNFGVGYDTTNVDEVARRGLLLSNTPGVLDDCVADTALGLLLDTMRGFSAADRYVRRGDWPVRGNYPLTRKVSGAKVGILGLGRIGLAIARRLEGFDVEVSYHNRHRRTDVSYQYRASLLDLATGCDALIIAAAGGPGTRGLVSAEVLAALGPDGFLINVARGSIVDQPALVAALTSGRLGGAGLDTFTDEPDIPAELAALDQVVLTPHVGSGTHETRQAMADLTLANVSRFRKDGTLVTPVPLP